MTILNVEDAKHYFYLTYCAYIYVCIYVRYKIKNGLNQVHFKPKV